MRNLNTRVEKIRYLNELLSGNADIGDLIEKQWERWCEMLDFEKVKNNVTKEGKVFDSPDIKETFLTENELDERIEKLKASKKFIIVRHKEMEGAIRYEKKPGTIFTTLDLDS